MLCFIYFIFLFVLPEENLEFSFKDMIMNNWHLYWGKQYNVSYVHIDTWSVDQI